jgi:zinc transporter ZupT
MGVSWAKSAHLGSFVSTSLALHNVPEGLAVAAVVVRSGAGPWAAAAWAIASSLPQPVAAVPAFLCVSLFEALTPAGLAFAAGAMLWVPISDLLPEACAELPPLRVAVVATVTAAAMFLVSHWLEG